MELNLVQVKVEDLKSVFNVRKDIAKSDLASLMASIGQVGILVPLMVYQENGHYVVIDGHRRLAAAIELDLQEVPCLVSDIPSAQEENIELQLTTNLQRSNLPPMDEAFAYNYLITEKEQSVVTVAKYIGKPLEYVRRRLNLLLLIKPLQKLLQERKIPTAVAELLAREIPATQKKFLQDGSSLNVGYVTGVLERNRTSLTDAIWDLKEDSWTKAGACSVCSKRGGNVDGLFPEEKSNICTDSDCFMLKYSTTLKTVMREAKAATKKEDPVPVFISTGTWLSGEDQEKYNPVLLADRYRVIKPGRSDFSTIKEGKGVFIDGTNAGKVVKIALEWKDAKGTVQTGKLSATEQKQKETEKKARMEKIVNEVQYAALFRSLQSVVEEQKDLTPLFQLTIEELKQHTNYDGWRRMGKALAVTDLKKGKYGGLDYETATEKLLDGLNIITQLRLLTVGNYLGFSNYGGKNQNAPLFTMAKFYDINVKKVMANAVKAYNESRTKKKAKKTNAKPKLPKDTKKG